jgi:hypothetical protein
VPDKALKVSPEYVLDVEHSAVGDMPPIRQVKQVNFKIPQQALYGVKNRLKMLIYFIVNGAFSPIFALSCTHLSNSILRTVINWENFGEQWTSRVRREGE